MSALEKKFATLQYEGFVTLRSAIVGARSHDALEVVRASFGTQVRGSSAVAPGSLASLDITMPSLKIAGRTISLAIHSLPVPSLYSTRTIWPLYGSLIVAAGPSDGSELDAMVATFVEHGRPVLSAETGKQIAAPDGDAESTPTPASLRAALAVSTKYMAKQLMPARDLSGAAR